MLSGKYETRVDGEGSNRKVFLVKRTDEVFEDLLTESEKKVRREDLIGKTISFSVSDIQGKRFDIVAMRGKVVVLNFWFVECSPCRFEMPELNDLYDEYKDNDEVVFLSLALNDEKKLRQFLKKTEFKYPVACLSKEIVNDIGIVSYPLNLVVDKEGICSYASAGVAAGSVTLLHRAIQNELLRRH